MNYSSFFKYSLIASAVTLTACANVQNLEIEPANVIKAKTTSEYTLGSGGGPTENQLDLSVSYAELNFTILPETETIIGQSTLHLDSSKSRNVFSVDLDRVFDIDYIAVNGVELSDDKYENPNGELIVRLDTPVQGKIELTLHYQGKPRKAVRAPWDGGFDWKTTPAGKPWVATAVQGEGCDLFWPCIDQPYGEVPKMDIKVTVPNGLVAATNGVLISTTPTENNMTTYHWRNETLINTYGVALNVGPYETIKAQHKSLFGNEFPVVFYHLDENVEQAKGLFAEIGPMIDFYESVIGPYPFANEKLGVVETSHLGMEHQTINAYGNKYKPDEWGYDFLLHHELAHEWFGNQLTNTDWSHMWLHEGFGTYMQPLYTQYLHGDMAYLAHLYKQRFYLNNKFPIVPKKSQTVDEIYFAGTGPGNDIYYKGSLILHSLRSLMGDENFFEAVRTIVYGTPDPKPGNFEPRFASTEDFIAIVNRISGEDLTWFFDNYLYHAALPNLVTNRTEETMTFEWQSTADSAFIMPLEVSINGKIKTLDMTKKNEIRVKRADVVIIDPNAKVLRQQDHVERYNNYLKSLRNNKKG